ncbi:hypothetical protein GOEFS_050_00220 [Gordonia effusa NBRC 100432]|uniref:Prepilin type IV endopeptidase peptidase domain-containing protein n=2 Tax=Gordonia effusa TaxID=263908 RepID=H0QZJ3_9ACTN|nr:hypothetical protein GOEFS_050_00220 [Gordonia effusa NBRC 100432]
MIDHVVESVAGVGIALWLLALAGVDARTMRLPNRWTLPALVAVSAAGIGDVTGGDPTTLIAACVAMSPYLTTFGLGHCGAGDVKLAYVLGGIVGDPLTALVLVLLAQVAMIIGPSRCRDSRWVPHGPALVGATILVAG